MSEEKEWKKKKICWICEEECDFEEEYCHGSYFCLSLDKLTKLMQGNEVLKDKLVELEKKLKHDNIKWFTHRYANFTHHLTLLNKIKEEITKRDERIETIELDLASWKILFQKAQWTNSADIKINRDKAEALKSVLNKHLELEIASAPDMSPRFYQLKELRDQLESAGGTPNNFNPHSNEFYEQVKIGSEIKEPTTNNASQFIDDLPINELNKLWKIREIAWDQCEKQKQELIAEFYNKLNSLRDHIITGDSKENNLENEIMVHWSWIHPLIIEYKKRLEDMK